MSKGDYDVRVALARAVAGRKVAVKDLEEVAARLDKFDTRIRGINPCIYGICLDFFLERPEIDTLISKALELGRVREIRVFPWGIPWPDLFRVQIEQQFEGIPEAVGQFEQVGR